MSKSNHMAPIEVIAGRVLFYAGAMAFSLGVLMIAGRLMAEAIRIWVAP